jgi:hypothetical protein
MSKIVFFKSWGEEVEKRDKVLSDKIVVLSDIREQIEYLK